jgi:hypothetical protein
MFQYFSRGIDRVVPSVEVIDEFSFGTSNTSRDRDKRC